MTLALASVDADDAVLVRLILRHRSNRDMVAAVRLVGLDHLGEAGLDPVMQHVGKQQRERLVADDVACAPDGVPEAERRLLAREAGVARAGKSFRQRRQLLLLVAALRERPVELELDVEVVLDHRLVAAGDENEVLDARGPRLVDHMLDDRPVDDRQHLFRHGLGCGKKARAQSGDGKHGFPDTFLLRHRAPAKGREKDIQNDAGRESEV